jgi:hypothetical protein
MAGSTKHRCGVDHGPLRRLERGVYEDASGRYLHLCLVEICEEAGYEPNSQNLDIAEEMLREVVARQWPGVPILVEPDGDARPLKSQRH